MIKIKDECVTNALGMLMSKPQYLLGTIKGTRYYLVDGKAWEVDTHNNVSRSDDSEETRQITQMMKVVNSDE